MAGETNTTTAPAAEGQAPAAQTPTPTVEELTKRLAEKEKEIGDLRKENAGHRHGKKEAEEKAAAEARAKAEKDGEWSKVLELERAEKKKLAEERETLAQKAARAEKLEATLAVKVKSLEEKLGDRAQKYAHLPLEDRLFVLEDIAALAAGPAAARSTTAGAPASVAPQIDISNMTAEQYRALPPDKKRQVDTLIHGSTRSGGNRHF